MGTRGGNSAYCNNTLTSVVEEWWWGGGGSPSCDNENGAFPPTMGFRSVGLTIYAYNFTCVHFHYRK